MLSRPSIGVPSRDPTCHEVLLACWAPWTPQLPLPLLPPRWDRRAVCHLCHGGAHAPQGSCPFLHLRWGRFFLLCSYQLP